MKVIIAADHAGFEYKQLLAGTLRLQGYELIDLGAQDLNEEDDYPDYASAVATALLNGEAQRGILICGSAVGVSIAANKFQYGLEYVMILIPRTNAWSTTIQHSLPRAAGDGYRSRPGNRIGISKGKVLSRGAAREGCAKLPLLNLKI